MKNLRAIHLYLGCVFAPLLILFTVTGAWQMFDLHQSKKDGSYVAPKILKALSSIHMNQRLPGSPHESGGLLRAFSLVAAIGLVTTTILGIVMAFRVSRSPGPVIACLLIGTVGPVLVLLL